MDANDFFSSIRYHFYMIFLNNNIFCNEIEILFLKSRKMRFNLDVLYSPKSHFELFDSKQNCCMYLLSI